MTNEEMIKRVNEISKYKYYCKCGHSVIIYPMEGRNKKICSWCGNWVYVNKKEEFKEKIGGMIR